MSDDLFSILNNVAGSPAPKAVAPKEIPTKVPAPKPIATNNNKPSESYTADDIEVLEGLEPVRRRPGMYIGGTDETAMHHLVSEVFDNAMDEAVAGFASRIELDLAPDSVVTVRDNGRGIPVDPHPRYPGKSALEVIFTTLHSGGKFTSKVYTTSGGLHGVGISVVNALSDHTVVEVARDKQLWRQEYSRGYATTTLANIGGAPNRRGTTVSFHPDEQIFGKARFKPARLYKLARSKAYLFKGVEIRWSCAPELLVGRDDVPAQETLHFPNGLADYMASTLENAATITPEPFQGEGDLAEGMGRVEWAVHWTADQDGFSSYYCNTVPTPQGGTHEQGLRAALLKGLRAFGDMAGNKKAEQITAEDVVSGICVILSLFFREPEFQGQTKEKLVSSRVAKLVENTVRDRLDLWLGSNPAMANALLEHVILRAEERLRKKNLKDTNRKTVVSKLRLPGKLADCTMESAFGTELFLVEGDSAGGSAKQARNRVNQAILPLRGKILNVASATSEKISQNQEIKDMLLALGCGTREQFKEEQLRYEKVIIMTDADVDGAHIASLLMTYFYQEMPQLIRGGHLYLAQPPLYRVTQGAQSFYPRDAAERDALIAKLPKNKGNIEVGRFKGLGEMTPPQLKETTMNPATRTLLRVEIAEEDEALVKTRVEQLMGKKPELRFRFIEEQSALLRDKLSAVMDV